MAVFVIQRTDPRFISLEVNRGRYDDGPGISLLVLGTADDHSAKRLAARRQDQGNLGLTAWSKKEIMKEKILINHWRWLQAQGPSYKQQATSCKLQASSLTRKLYNGIGLSITRLLVSGVKLKPAKQRKKNYENK